MGCCISAGAAPRSATAYQTSITPAAKKIYEELPGDTCVIIVKLIAAHGLPITDMVMKSSDPFFVFEVKPDGAVGGNQKQRSTHKPRTLDPKWDPPLTFRFIAADVPTCKIVISAWDYQLNGMHRDMGQTMLLAKDVTEEPQIMKKKISDPNTGKAVGEVEFQVFSMPAGRAKTMETHTAYEFERFEPIVGWGHDSPGHLLPTDPGRWCSGDGKKWSLQFDEVVPELRAGFTVSTPWSVFMGEEMDTSGWEYGVDFNSHSWYSEQGKTTFARRRMWNREVVSSEYTPPAPAEVVSPVSEVLNEASTTDN